MERLTTLLLALVALSGVAALLLILVFVGKEALPLFTRAASREVAPLSRMFLPQPGFVWQPISAVPKVSMVPLWLGTLKVSLFALVIAAPLGLLAALYCAEFAARPVRELLKPSVELLAGIPSVVLGFFALEVIAGPVQSLFQLTYRLNGLVAALGLSLALVPVVFTLSEDALRAVPQSYREASLALGAGRWETAWRVVLPAAAPGVVAACILALGRAVGETMVVLMASGNAPVVSLRPGDSVRTMAATIAAEMGELVTGSVHESLLFFIGAQLLLLTVALNAVAGWWRRRVFNQLTGSGAAR
jgi:phosphate transport system permease protein